MELGPIEVELTPDSIDSVIQEMCNTYDVYCTGCPFIQKENGDPMCRDELKRIMTSRGIVIKEIECKHSEEER